MRFAAFETATEWCSAALWVDGEIVSVEERAGNRHAERLLPMLDQAAACAGISLGALSAVAFGCGPGSFTGLRIACGVAQGIALARDLPVLGVSTLQALAQESGLARVIACLDARMHEVYYSALERQHSGWREVIPALCVAPAAAPLPPGEGWTGCGNGFSVYAEAFRSRISSMIPDLHPSAVAVARLAAPRLAAGEGVDAALAAPVYLRDKVAFTVAEREAR